MKYELWLLSAVTEDSIERPWASVHPTVDEALKHVLSAYEVRLPSDAPRTEKAVEAVLAGIASFSIELVIIDVDEMEST